MKCEEVMELMQRHIDGDLEQHEISLMMDHADRCSDCAAMLSRLRKLSSELEQLPRVVPKFSIVDSILPELERLHAEGATSGANEAAVDPAAASPAPTSARSQRPSRNFYRKISGVVAAGIVVGFLLFSSPGEWLKSGGSQDQAAMPDLASAPEARQEAASAPEAGLYSMSETSGGAQAQDQYGAEIQPKSISPSSKEDVPQPSAEMRNNNMSNDEDVTGGSGNVQDKEPVEVEVTQRQTLTGEEDPEMAGLAAIPAEQADSPDAKWKAVSVTGSGTFEVYKIENGELLYHSEPREGSIGQLTWNEEGTVLSFTVIDADGNAKEWQFDTETLTESQK